MLADPSIQGEGYNGCQCRLRKHPGIIQPVRYRTPRASTAKWAGRRRLRAVARGRLPADGRPDRPRRHLGKRIGVHAPGMRDASYPRPWRFFGGLGMRYAPGGAEFLDGHRPGARGPGFRGDGPPPGPLTYIAANR